ncbi:hypothetical protein [Burkholderia ambifaria]|uniref:hypothetical protein n=1 Tax=Burkholderia ambifaria TaxID=152480 RepID=UPI001591FBC9|nr:hypothetical protein [Burkholderia ambifaria]
MSLMSQVLTRRGRLTALGQAIVAELCHAPAGRRRQLLRRYGPALENIGSWNARITPRTRTDDPQPRSFAERGADRRHVSQAGDATQQTVPDNTRVIFAPAGEQRPVSPLQWSRSMPEFDRLSEDRALLGRSGDAARDDRARSYIPSLEEAERHVRLYMGSPDGRTRQSTLTEFRMRARQVAEQAEADDEAGRICTADFLRIMDCLGVMFAQVPDNPVAPTVPVVSDAGAGNSDPADAPGVPGVAFLRPAQIGNAWDARQGSRQEWACLYIPWLERAERELRGCFGDARLGSRRYSLGQFFQTMEQIETALRADQGTGRLSDEDFRVIREALDAMYHHVPPRSRR